MAEALYLDASVALRATLEAGTTPEVESQIAQARILLTSRLSLVESARALIRARTNLRLSEKALADVEREIDSLWARCDIWEISSSVCDLASRIVPGKGIRTLDALHLATFLMARRRIPGIELLTTDERLEAAVKFL
jgi:predicted nucleic acid-binding protein